MLREQMFIQDELPTGFNDWDQSKKDQFIAYKLKQVDHIQRYWANISRLNVSRKLQTTILDYDRPDLDYMKNK